MADIVNVTVGDNVLLSGGSIGAGGTDGNDFPTSGVLTGTNLTLTIPNQADVVVDLSTLLDNTDAQTLTDLSLTGNVLSVTLSGGNTATVDLSTLNVTMSDAEVKTAYENNVNTNAFTDAEQSKLGAITGTNTGDQSLSLTGQDLSISGGNTVTLPISGSTTNNFNNEFRDSTGDGLVGVQDGTNTTFTVSQSEYQAGSVKAYLNGQLLWNGAGITETTPASGVITFETAPLATDGLYVEYVVGVTNSADLQEKITLTTTGTSGAATLTGTTLNIPQYLGGGGTTNPNVTIATTLSDITNATNQIIDLQEPITLAANYTFPADKIIVFSTGKIILNGFTLTGNNTRPVFNQEEIGIDAFTGTINGTWDTPDKIYANNFGTRAEGKDVFDGNISLGSTTLTSATAGFTANDVGKWISIVAAGQPPVINFNTPSGTFTVSETVTFSGGATATISSLTASSMVIVMVSGNTPQKDETITGGTSGATAIVSGSTEDNAYALVTTITGFTNSTTVTINTPALSNATNTTVVYGWNDRNAIEQASYVRNRKSGVLSFPSKYKYYHNAIQSNPLLRTRPYSYIIGDDTDGIIWEVNGHLQLFPHEVQDSKTFVIWRTKGSGFTGSGKIYGDYIYHTEENGRGEGNHGIFGSTLANDITIIGKGLDISYWYGDALYGSGDTQFMNQIDGANFVDGSTESAIAQGNILPNGTIDTADTQWYYTPTLLTLEGFQFDNITSRGLQRFVHLTGASFGGWEGMRTPYFKIAFYNSSDALMFVTNELVWYDKVYIPDGATQARVTFSTPLDPANIQLNLRPDLNPDGSIIEGVTISHCGRQGISNWASNTTIRNVYGHHIGGLDAGPGYFLDYEDGGRIKKNIIVENSTFENNWGDIILKGCDNVIIANNTFKASTIATNNSTLANIETGVSSLFGRNTKVYGNTFYNKRNSLDRQDHFYNNIQKGGDLSFTANGNIVESNQLWNVYITHAPDASRDRQNHPTIFKNNYIKYNRRKEGYWFYNINNAASFINNIFKWNDVGDWNFAAESTDSYMVSGLNSFDQIHLDQAQGTDFKGEFRGNKYEGILPAIGTRDYDSGKNRPLMTSSIDEVYEMPIEHTFSLPKDYTYRNRTIFGWLEYDLNQFETSIISPTPTISHLGGKIHLRASDGYSWTNGGSNLLSTEARNAKFYFKDFSFIIEQTFTYNGVSSQKLFDINHLGTTVFENCTFDLQGMPNYVMDMTQTLNFGANLGAVTFIDPVFKNGFTVVLRAQDKILYTKPNVKAPTYADNATALAALGAGYYYKLTGTGEFKITF